MRLKLLLKPTVQVAFAHRCEGRVVISEDNGELQLSDEVKEVASNAQAVVVYANVKLTGMLENLPVVKLMDGSLVMVPYLSLCHRHSAVL